jgi:MYXO-CTERM domain-containing protein
MQTNGGAASVPDAGHTPAALGVILAGLATLRRRLQP